jgi:hypothetical protein
MPSNRSLGSIETHCYVFHSSCPATLIGLDRKATAELLTVLIETLNRDYATNLNPAIITASSWVKYPEIHDPLRKSAR